MAELESGLLLYISFSEISVLNSVQVLLLLTWINFYPSMDK